jgi:hypothetical protein
MKTGPRLSVPQNPNPVFVEAACAITKPPPAWLVAGLEHFGPSITRLEAYDRQFHFARLDAASEAMDELLKFLPAFQHLGYGLQCPKDVTVVLDALPRIKADIDRLTIRKRNRPRTSGQQTCAAVVVEAWKLVHDKAQPRSTKVYQACADYWTACKRKEVGDWERAVKYALTANDPNVRTVLMALQNSA